jgi:predicted ATPase
MNTINTGQFVSPESTGHDQLFGRENEKTLLAEMLDVVCCGRTALCFVSGYAGSGKTSLVKQLKPEVEKRKGLFVSGKFDQYHKDIPYSAFIEILRNLARQLLMKNETELSSWRKKITKALYPNSRIIIDLVPELEYITGPQNKAPDIDPVNAENRFKHCFGEFFKILADGHTPFVIFLDDMHWADPASLKIIIHLIRTDPAPGLYIAGAYRDNEVNDTHILVRMIDEILVQISCSGTSVSHPLSRRILII